jgi:hypothetical protein
MTTAGFKYGSARTYSRTKKSGAFSKDRYLDFIVERLDHYLEMGVANVWIIDPRLDGVLRSSNPDVSVPLAALFD